MSDELVLEIARLEREVVRKLRERDMLLQQGEAFNDDDANETVDSRANSQVA